MTKDEWGRKKQRIIDSIMKQAPFRGTITHKQAAFLQKCGLTLHRDCRVTYPKGFIHG